MKARIAARLAKFRAAVGALLVSAFVWYLVLAVVGSVFVGVGVGLQFGVGYGVLAAGMLCLCGSELLRRGMMRA